MAKAINFKSLHSLVPCVLTNFRRRTIIHARVVKDPHIQESQLSLRMSSSEASKMHAWQIQKYGGIEELTLNTSASAAAIKSPNELLVKVHAASINPIDVRMLGGYGRTLINVLRKQRGGLTSETEFPLILGRDFSGTVVETGKGVNKFQVGDEVWGALSAERPGTHSKYTVVSQDEISKKPENVSHVEAASFPYVVGTAWAALCVVGELNERKASMKRILILGGSGGIGTFAVQLCKAWGMQVVAICSTDAVELVSGLGAQVLDYKTKDVWNELQRVEKFDYILDTLGGDNTNKAFSFLKPWQNAHLITLVSPLLKNSDNFGVVPGLLRTAMTAGVDTVKGLQSGRSLRWAVFMPSGVAMEKVRQMVEFGQPLLHQFVMRERIMPVYKLLLCHVLRLVQDKIKPIVQQVFPFSQVPAGFKRVSDGHLRGKIVIDTLQDT